MFDELQTRFYLPAKTFDTLDGGPGLVSKSLSVFSTNVSTHFLRGGKFSRLDRKFNFTDYLRLHGVNKI